MSKTPDYTKTAIAKYQAGKDRLNLLMDAGTKDRIKALYGDDVSITAYIKKLVSDDLDKMETANRQQKSADQGSDLPEFMRY